MILNPKFDVNQTVFVYEKGKVVEKVVKYIQIIISGVKTEVGYQFLGQDVFLSRHYTPESEVFASKEEFYVATQN